ncbi:hypothetical protein ACFS6H_09925 [Terrimonas rubra]|uniref:DKNYY family protein n=1 Tax=Terrimonas rubra TaxID=1035890 RepID=A0ABW6A5Z5_9BACT
MKFFLLLLSVIIGWSLQAQNVIDNKPVNIKEGTFYYYPQGFTDSYKMLRKGAIQKEYKLQDVSDDPLELKIDWLNDSTYTLRYVDGGNFKEEEKKYFRGVVRYLGVDKVTDSYYIYTRYSDSTFKKPMLRDTMWVAPKKQMSSRKLLFELVRTKTELEELETDKKPGFALLYFYSPYDENYSGTAKEVSMNNMDFTVIANGLSFAYKFYKEGFFQLLDNLDDKNPLGIDIEFGKSYYIKNTFSGLTKDPKVNFKLMDHVKGEKEFKESAFFETPKDN